MKSEHDLRSRIQKFRFDPEARILFLTAHQTVSHVPEF